MERRENSDPSIYWTFIYNKTRSVGKEWIDFSTYGAEARNCSHERE